LDLTAVEPELPGAPGTVTPAFVNSHIWPTEGQIWGTLVRGKKTFPGVVSG
jgi:hypothetical protein